MERPVSPGGGDNLTVEDVESIIQNTSGDNLTVEDVEDIVQNNLVNAAPMPKAYGTNTSIVGTWTSDLELNLTWVGSSSWGGAYTYLPAGGTWAYKLLASNMSTRFPQVAGIAAGGSIFPANANTTTQKGSLLLYRIS